MNSEERDFIRKMTMVADSIIGGRYIGFAMKAEGMVFITAEQLTAKEIDTLIKKINTQMMGDASFKELDSNRWAVKPTNYQRGRYVVEKAPLTRKRYVEERTPLMEVRLYNA